MNVCRFRLSYLFWIILLLGCNENNNGYERIDEDQYFKLIVPGDEGIHSNWEVIELLVEPGIRKFHKLHPLLILRKDLSKAPVDQKLAWCVPGDSVAFISLGKQPELGALSSYVAERDSVFVKILAKRSLVEQKRIQERVIDSMEQVESRQIQEWIKQFNTKEVDVIEQVVVLNKETDTSQRMISCDSLIKIHYRGMLQNGQIVDISGEDGFEYKVCTPGQLVPGIVSIVKRSRQGDKLKIILPSQLAFGVYGSNNGRIPPFTPVLYELQIE